MQNNLLRILFFFILVLLGFSGPIWFFAIGAIAYIFLFLGLEMLILSAAIDAYFGYGSDEWFIYTIVTAAALLFVQWLKPQLSVYNQ
jgi:hypothetical protein